MLKDAANRVRKSHFFSEGEDFRIAKNARAAHHHVQEEEVLLDLPCDWRFLPKLGLAGRNLWALSSVIGFAG